MRAERSTVLMRTKVLTGGEKISPPNSPGDGACFIDLECQTNLKFEFRAGMWEVEGCESEEMREKIRSVEAVLQYRASTIT